MTIRTTGFIEQTAPGCTALAARITAMQTLSDAVAAARVQIAAATMGALLAILQAAMVLRGMQLAMEESCGPAWALFLSLLLFALPPHVHQHGKQRSGSGQRCREHPATGARAKERANEDIEARFIHGKLLAVDCTLDTG
jgi:hypothetical protein